MVLLALVASVPSIAEAQKLATIIRDLAGDIGENAVTNTDHEAHFINGNNLAKFPRALNQSLATQLSTFPIGSSSGGFTATRSATGEITATSSSFGPSFSERALTLGQGNLSFGFSFQTTNYDSFDGVGLDSGGLRFTGEHNDCCIAVNNREVTTSDPNAASPFNPFFERDLLESRFSLNVETRTAAFLASAGITDRLDVGIAVPIVHVELDATVQGTILRTASAAVPELHSFDGAGQSVASLSASGTASGLGDISLRAKYNFLRDSGTALAGAVDLRLPTGDEDDLLGTGATRTKLFFIMSGEYGRVSPHANVGYTFSEGTSSDLIGQVSERRQSIGGREQPGFIQGGAGGATPSLATATLVNLDVPDEVNYTLGADVVASPFVTVSFDVLGRTLRDVPLFARGQVVFENRGPGSVPPGTASFTVTDELLLADESGNLNLLLGIAGVKINIPNTRLLINVSVIFPMVDNGLKPNVTPVVGFDYGF
jgi:hypothetical protein